MLMIEEISQETWLGRGKHPSTAMFNNSTDWASQFMFLSFISLPYGIKRAILSTAMPVFLANALGFHSTFTDLRTVPRYPFSVQ